jgi:hypothetical protein
MHLPAIKNGAAVLAERVFYGKPLVFKEKSHRYFWGGEPVPSVTTILGRLAKNALVQWAADCATEHMAANMQDTAGVSHETFTKLLEEARKEHIRRRNAAGIKGAALHKYASDCFQQGVLLPNIGDDPLCKAFGDWWSKHVIHPIDVERLLMSEKLMYAGRCDFFGRIDGKLGVLDIKTGGETGKVYEESWLQLCGYELALVEELGLQQPLVRWVLQLDKTSGKFVLHEQAMSAPYLHAWVCLVNLDKFMRIISKAI